MLLDQTVLSQANNAPCTCNSENCHIYLTTPPPVDNQTATDKLIDFPIGKFIKFLRKIRFEKLLNGITDPRDQSKIHYKIETLLFWAISVFFFRLGSVNAFYTALENVNASESEALRQYLGLNSGQDFPHRTSVTNALSQLDPDEINALLMALFKHAIKRKVFYNHAAKLTPNNTFYLACDGLWFHTHPHPHATDEKGNCSCPYCLPRVYKKGTEEEYTHRLHACVNFCVIFPGGLQLPLYVHMLKSSQVTGKEALDDAAHKQECELQAAHLVLPFLKKQLPKLPITVLADSLYANEPFLKLCEENGWDYLITRKEGSLRKVGKQCEERLKHEHQEKWYTAKQTTKITKGMHTKKKVTWFNDIYVGETVRTNVIRMEETYYDSSNNIAKTKDEKEKKWKTEWLSSKRINKDNCFSLTKAARIRADHEDLHNTLKNRGFAAKHEHAYANPTAWIVWKLLMFVAFWIFELFSYTKQAQEAKGTLSWQAFARGLFAELTKIPWSILQHSFSKESEKMQFRFIFSG